MARFVSAEDWSEIDLPETKGAEVSMNVHMPFVIVKEHTPDHEEYEQGENDVVVRGPVYVGNDDMLDRHGELVDMGAIQNAWTGYKANPVILYNHSKTYGVIGRMTDVEMGEWPGFDFPVPIGRAVIDGAEEDIVRKIRKGFLRSFSIGFMAKAAVKECKDEDTCYMRFTDIEWIETSVVDIPSSRDALFSVEKTWLLPTVPIPDTTEPEVEPEAVEKSLSESCGEGDCGCGCIEVRAPYDDINFSVPAGVKAELLKGLAWHEEGHSGDGLVAATVSWARRMASGQDISPDKAVKMRAWLARHESDKSGEGFSPGEDGFPSPGRVAWALWGGDAAKGWSSKLVGQMEAADNRSAQDDAVVKIDEETEYDHLLTFSHDEMQTLHSDGIIDLKRENGAEEMIIRVVYESPVLEESLKYPFSQSKDKSEETNMTEELDQIESPVIEEPIALAQPEEELKSVDNNLPSPTEVMMAVAGSLTTIEQRLSALEESMKGFDNGVELSATIDGLQATIKTLQTEKASNEEELRIAQEVEARVKNALASLPTPITQEAPVAALPERKSVAVAQPTAVPKRAPLDPAIKVSKGMDGLASWLEGRLAHRGGMN